MLECNQVGTTVGTAVGTTVGTTVALFIEGRLVGREDGCLKAGVSEGEIDNCGNSG